MRGRGREAVESWRRYRETQLSELAESNRLQREMVERRHLAPPPQTTLPGLAGTGSDRAAADATGASTTTGASTAGASTTTGASTAGASTTTGASQTGTSTTGTSAEAGGATTGEGTGRAPGAPGGPQPEEPIVERRREMMMVTSPFMFGFFGALGVLVAWWLAQNVSQLSSVITFVVIAIFLTLSLNPIVESLTHRGMNRSSGVFTVFVGLILVLGLFSWLVVPTIVSETSTLIERAPRYVEDLGNQEWVTRLDAEYDVSSRLETEFENRLQDTTFISTIFGGVLGAAGALAGGLIGAFTALVLTLYFLAALPTVKDAAYKIVPLSRRARVIGLAEEIMRRVGGYALGQVAVATINGTCSWIMMQLLGVPYAIVLAVLVGMLGLIPLVGATLGAVIVALVALSQGWVIALVVCIYYLVYQQFENYVIVPRIMARTVSVPGAVTVVAVLAGGTLMGVLGALVAIPVAAGMLLLYNEVVVPRQNRL
ncbi:AI-2E family transporter [Ornithinimicrobium murale]|uniref:AI-2E family transporter n=1 Tax=Ornithinimicrobium murale TaxID=1050153 RepID=UPI001EDFC400|nr:AI-2E family transporter [Ornithinimicrobium murale]